MVSGRLTVPRWSWCDLVDVSVAGDARIGGAGVRIAGSTIGGDLDVIGTQSAADPLSAQTNIVCNSTVHGDLVVAGSGFAAPWDIGQCGPNVIHGDLVFAGNHASGNSIEGNTIDRDLVCARNGGLHIVFDNTVERTDPEDAAGSVRLAWRR